MKGKKALAIVAVVLILCVVGAWLAIKSGKAKAPNMPPIAALRLDFVDETNRVATLSDNGSHDQDGTLQSWRIAWGDGKEDNLSAVPKKASHTYDAEGAYTISVWCMDNSGATSAQPAVTNITFDFMKRQQALEEAQAEAKREADRLKAEQARKEAERLEQEKALAAEEARKAREQQELEAKQRAEAELAAQKAKEAAKPPPPPPTPLASALTDDPATRRVIFTPSGYTHGAFQIAKDKTEAMENGKLPVILLIRCVNFPDTPIPTSAWQIDGKNVPVQAGRIRAALSPGRHDVTAFLSRKPDSGPTELKADVTVGASGECVVTPRN